MMHKPLAIILLVAASVFAFRNEDGDDENLEPSPDGVQGVLSRQDAMPKEDNRDFRFRAIRKSWVLICRKPCTQELIDRMDISQLKLGYVMKSPTSNHDAKWGVKTVFGWDGAREDGSLPMRGPDGRVVTRYYSSYRLTNLEGAIIKDESLCEDCDALGHLLKVAQSVDYSEEWYFPIMTAFSTQQQNDEYNRYSVWRQQASWDADSILDSKRKHQEAKKKKAKEEADKLRRALRKQFDTIHDMVRSLKRQIIHSIQHSPSKLQCGSGLHGDFDTAKESLDSGREEHDDERKDLNEQVAAISVAVLFAGLQAAADAGAPGLGTVFKATGKAAEVYEKAGQKLNKLFMRTPLGAALRNLQGTLQKVSASIFKVEASIDMKLSGPMSDIAAGFTGTASEELNAGLEDSMWTSAKKIIQGDTVQLQALVASAKESAQACVVAGGIESTWTAASFIPLVGPFISMGRSMIELADVGRTSLQSQRNYYAMKDPILRSLLHMRDCSLLMFLNTDALAMSKNTSLDYEARSEALLQAMDLPYQAFVMNQDLVERLHKQVWWFQSADDHEKRVMNRLTTGHSKVGTISLGSEELSYLHNSVLKPSLWQEKLGASIERTWLSLRDVADEGPHTPK